MSFPATPHPGDPGYAGDDGITGAESRRRALRSFWLRWIATLVGIVVVIALVIAGTGWLGSRDPYAIDAESAWEGESAVATIGPNGWFVARDDGEQEVRNIRTGESYRQRFSLIDQITADGGYLSAGFESLSIYAPGGELTAEVENRDLAGDVEIPGGLNPSDEPRLVGLSEDAAVTLTCFAPGDEGFSDEAEGTVAVLAGVSLADGTVLWSRDVQAVCSHDLAAQVGEGMEPTTSFLSREGDGQTRVIGIDDGEVLVELGEVPLGRAVLQGERVIVRQGNEVRVVDLASGEDVESLDCAGARLTNPGEFSDRLSVEATPGVICEGGRAFVIDAQTAAATEVAAVPVPEGQLVPDGSTVLVDRALISRDGRAVTLVDAHSGDQIAEIELDRGFRVATNDPKGRLLRFFISEDARDGGVDTRHRVIDLRTGEWLVRDVGRGLSPGAAVAPDGRIMLSASGTPPRGTGPTRTARVPARTWLFVAGD